MNVIRDRVWWESKSCHKYLIKDVLVCCLSATRKIKTCVDKYPTIIICHKNDPLTKWVLIDSHINYAFITFPVAPFIYILTIFTFSQYKKWSGRRALTYAYVFELGFTWKLQIRPEINVMVTDTAYRHTKSDTFCLHCYMYSCLIFSRTIGRFLRIYKKRELAQYECPGKYVRMSPFVTSVNA